MPGGCLTGRSGSETARGYLPPWLNVAAGYGARDGGVRTGVEARVVCLGLDFEPLAY